MKQDPKLETLEMVYGSPMQVVSDLLRSVLIAPEGKIFDVADYASIEARVLFWVAEHSQGLKAFFENRPMYEEQAADIFKIAIENVTKDQRFVGKQAFLGAGYGMGPKKFQATCHNFGEEISEELASRAIHSYRSIHGPVVALWGNIEKAAVAAVENLGKKYRINKTAWWVKDEFLWCKLPSGRCLAYHRPCVEYLPTPWGERKAVLHHWGENSVTHKWEKQKTWGGTLVENVVQAISRDLMASAMLRIEQTGLWDIVLSVHDELIGERHLGSRWAYDNTSVTNKDFCRLMAALPSWAEGCPVRVEGFETKRYCK